MPFRKCRVSPDVFGRASFARSSRDLPNDLTLLFLPSLLDNVLARACRSMNEINSGCRSERTNVSANTEHYFPAKSFVVAGQRSRKNPAITFYCGCAHARRMRRPRRSLQRALAAATPPSTVSNAPCLAEGGLFRRSRDTWRQIETKSVRVVPQFGRSPSEDTFHSTTRRTK